MPRLSEGERNQILKLYKKGFTFSKISTRMGISRKTVTKWLKQFEAQGKIRIVQLPTYCWARNAAVAQAAFEEARSAIDPTNPPLPKKEYRVKPLRVKKDKKKARTPSKTPGRVKGEGKRDVKPNLHKLLADDQEDFGSNSNDDQSEDEARDTFLSQSQEVPVASTSAGGAGEGLYDTLRCDSCGDAIPGIRQVCVECEYTHCMSCEARGAHAHHYMLRVPGPRPEGVVKRIVKMIQVELANIISDDKSTVDPNIEPVIIKTEIKIEPDPLAEEHPSAEQLRPSVLEQSMLDIVVKQEFDSDDEVVDPPDESATLQEAPSASSDCTATLPTTYPVQASGESSSNKRRSSSASQASAAKKTFITVDCGSINVTVHTEPNDESLQTHQEASGFGESRVTSNQTETHSKQEETGRKRKGTAAKKKVKQ